VPGRDDALTLLGGVGFRGLFELSPDAVMLYVGGVVVAANPAAARLLAAPDAGALVGKRSTELVHPDSISGIEQRAAALMRGEPAGPTVERYLRLDGSPVEVEAHASRIPNTDGKVFLVVLRDLGPRREASRLRAAERDATMRERWMRELLDLLPTWVCARDDDGRFVLANRTFAAAVGRPPAEVEGRTLSELGVPRDVARRLLEADRAALTTEGPLRTENEPFVTGGGGAWTLDTTRTTLALGERTVVLCASVDVTERQRLETELVHSERLDTIGRLASGLAHDFNNLLTVISSAAEALAESAGDAHRQDATLLRDATTRAAALTRNLLAFARNAGGDAGTCELRSTIDGLGPTLRHVAGERVQVTMALSPALNVRVRLHPGELERILVNLAVNARDAMATGGTLRISAEPGPGGTAILEVADDGVGMDADTRARAFEPFFSTRGGGQGAGLGLPTCAALVVRAGGTISLDSAPGRGTIVRIGLPGGARDPSRARGTEPPLERRSVLLVDDDPFVRRATARQLERLGHTVVVAASADEALAAITASEDIALVITDVVMPGRSGIDLARELEALRPELAVLLISGYSPDELPAGSVFLAKPFSRGSLASKIGEALAIRRR
jgi:PAS domain S-box-containing protein